MENPRIQLFVYYATINWKCMSNSEICGDKENFRKIINLLFPSQLQKESFTFKDLTHAFLVHPFSTPEKIIKPYGFLMFSGYKKRTLGTNGLISKCEQICSNSYHGAFCENS